MKPIDLPKRSVNGGNTTHPNVGVLSRLVYGFLGSDRFHARETHLFVPEALWKPCLGLFKRETTMTTPFLAWFTRVKQKKPFVLRR